MDWLRPTMVAALALAFLVVPTVTLASTPTTNAENTSNDVQLNAQFDGWALTMDRGDPSHVYICGEMPLGNQFSFLSCGSGSGILYQPTPDDIDITHFRANYSVSLANRVDMRPGVGLAEIQRGRDDPGFVFRPNARRQPRLTEASGPEAALTFEWDPHRLDGPVRNLTVSWDSGVAWIPAAPAVLPSSSPVVPFTTLTINGSF